MICIAIHSKHKQTITTQSNIDIVPARSVAVDVFTGVAQLGRFTLRDEGHTYIYIYIHYCYYHYYYYYFYYYYYYC